LCQRRRDVINVQLFFVLGHFLFILETEYVYIGAIFWILLFITNGLLHNVSTVLGGGTVGLPFAFLFDVLLTVHLSIILVINQLNAQILVL